MTLPDSFVKTMIRKMSLGDVSSPWWHLRPQKLYSGFLVLPYQVIAIFCQERWFAYIDLRPEMDVSRESPDILFLFIIYFLNKINIQKTEMQHWKLIMKLTSRMAMNHMFLLYIDQVRIELSSESYSSNPAMFPFTLQKSLFENDHIIFCFWIYFPTW